MDNKNLRWFALDYSAKLYPALITKHTQSLFRVSIYLKEKVDPEILNHALIDIMSRFPAFNVRLRRGLFWYFIEENTKTPKVFHDDGIVLKKINATINNHFLFTVIYHNTRISIEFFHAITDGLSGSEFLKALTFRYLTLKGEPLEYDNNIIDLNSIPKEEEYQDCFSTNYTKQTLKSTMNKSANSISGDDAHRITGTRYEMPGYGIIECVVPSTSLLDVARSKNLTVTTYIGAAFLYSVYKQHKMKKFKPLTLFIPINLRKVFNCYTLRNFVLFSRAGVRKHDKEEELTFEDFAQGIQDDLAKDTKKQNLQDRINGIVFLENFWLMRFLPLPIKYFFFKIGKMFVRKNNHTAILSNLGRISMPPSLEERIDGMSMNINVAHKVPISMGVVSAAGKTRIMFTTLLQEREILRSFISILRQDKIDVDIISNLREDKRYVL